MERRCKYCNKQLDVSKGEYHVCLDCQQFNHPALYRKLGVRTDQPLRQSYQDSFEILKHLYFQENLSVIEIFKKTGVCHKTLKNVFQDFGETLRNLSEGQRIAIQENRTKLPEGSNRYKRGFHESWDGRKFQYRSSYELDYAKELDMQKIPYRFEEFRIYYWNSEEGKQRIAIPDFYLPNTNELVEIKSRWTYRQQEMKDKFAAYRSLGYKPKLILEHKELDL